MLHERENPIGIDFIIDRIQKQLYQNLSTKWGVEIEGYPRCYVLEDKEGRRSIQHYLRNEEYSGTLIYSEENKFFFTAEENQERVNNFQFKTKIQLFFILDLKTIYPNSKDRMDGNVLSDVVKILDNSPGISPEMEVITHNQNVFDGFDYEFENIQPYYYFRIELNTMPYSMNKNC